MSSNPLAGREVAKSYFGVRLASSEEAAFATGSLALWRPVDGGNKGIELFMGVQDTGSLSVFGGRRLGTDADAVETAVRHFYDESGRILDDSVSEQMSIALRRSTEKCVYWRRDWKAASYFSRLAWDYGLPEHFAAKSDQVFMKGDIPMTGLAWVPFERVYQTLILGGDVYVPTLNKSMPLSQYTIEIFQEEEVFTYMTELHGNHGGDVTHLILDEPKKPAADRVPSFSHDAAHSYAYTCGFGCTLREPDEAEVERARKALKRLVLACTVCLVFMGVEFAGGYMAGSLALMSDATHLLSDLASMMISVAALWLAQKAGSRQMSFGYHRAEILGALISVLVIWVLTAWLVSRAIARIQAPEHVDGPVMVAVAAAGMVANVVMGLILWQSGADHHHLGHSHDHGGHGHGHAHAHAHSGDDHSDDSHSHPHSVAENVNVRAAFVHVLGDLIQSLGVLIAGLLIWYDPKMFELADPVCTLLFAVIVLWTTKFLLRDLTEVLMEKAPRHIDLLGLRDQLLGLEDVRGVHDLHVWALSVNKYALSVHLQVESSCVDESGAAVQPCTDGVLRAAQQLCKNEFAIDHCTIQVEFHRKLSSGDSACPEYCADPSGTRVRAE